MTGSTIDEEGTSWNRPEKSILSNTVLWVEVMKLVTKNLITLNTLMWYTHECVGGKRDDGVNWVMPNIPP